MLRQIQDEIIKLKKEKDICILAHSYQSHDILEVADFTGDSYQLSVMAKEAPNKTVIMCGVRFMAETVKLLSPEKRVILSNPVAGCPMAEQISKKEVVAMKKKYPDYTVVAYINTTTELKTVCDVCVTSSSAVKIVNNIENDNIIFLPDQNLGQYVKKQCPDKNIVLMEGSCPVHAAVSERDALLAKERYPNALLLVHPECVPAVVAHADFVGSTSAIINFAKESEEKEFIIGTEISIAEHLQFECPEKDFYFLSKRLICPNMKATTLMDVYKCVTGTGGEEIVLPDNVAADAVKCIDKMIELG